MSASARLGRRPPWMFVVTDSVSLGFLRGQLSFIKQRGHEVIAVSSPGAALCGLRERYGIPTVGLSMRRAPSIVRDLVSFVRLILLLLRLRPALLCYSTPKASVLAGLAGVITRIPVRVYLVWGLRHETLPVWFRQAGAMLERLTCALAHEVIAVSASVKARLVEEGLVDCARVRTIGCGSSGGVDSTYFDQSRVNIGERASFREKHGIPANAPVILFVGRLVRDKGIPELVDAFIRLKTVVPEAYLVVAGRLERFNGLSKALVTTMRPENAIVMTGHLDDVRQACAAADVVALPSHREGFPNVALEAAAMGLPVVTTRATGCVDAVVDGVTGTLVPVGDVDALTDALGAYLVDSDLRRRHGAAGRARVIRDFQPRRIWEETYARYVELIEDARKAGRLQRRHTRTMNEA